MKKGFVFFYLMLYAVFTFSASPSRAEEAAQYLGKYTITGTRVYGGGLTSDEMAEKSVGVEVLLGVDVYRFLDSVVVHPVYKMEKIKIDKGEGNILPRNTSMFYGVGKERDFVERILVFDPKNKKQPKNVLEVIDNDNLLKMYDGHFYFVKKKSGR